MFRKFHSLISFVLGLQKAFTKAAPATHLKRLHENFYKKGAFKNWCGSFLGCPLYVETHQKKLSKNCVYPTDKGAIKPRGYFFREDSYPMFIWRVPRTLQAYLPGNIKQLFSRPLFNIICTLNLLRIDPGFCKKSRDRYNVEYEINSITSRSTRSLVHQAFGQKMARLKILKNQSKRPLLLD